MIRRRRIAENTIKLDIGECFWVEALVLPSLNVEILEERKRDLGLKVSPGALGRRKLSRVNVNLVWPPWSKNGGGAGLDKEKNPVGLRWELRELAGEFTRARGAGPCIRGFKAECSKVRQTSGELPGLSEVRPRTPRGPRHSGVHDDGESWIRGETLASQTSSKQK